MDEGDIFREEKEYPRATIVNKIKREDKEIKLVTATLQLMGTLM